MNKKSVILGVVIALLGAGGVFAYQYFFSGPRPADYGAACAYDDCDYQGEVNLRPGDPYPPKCPKCGRNSVLPLAKCKKCGNRQNLNEERRIWIPELKDLPPKTTCAQCGGAIVHGD